MFLELFFCFLLVVGSEFVAQQTGNHVQFLDVRMVGREWDDFQQTVDCLGTTGFWQSPMTVPNRKERLSTVCVESIVRLGACANSSQINYQWELAQSHTCQRNGKVVDRLQELSRESFCRAFSGHHVLAVGDSLTTFLGASVVNAFFEGLEPVATRAHPACRHTCLHLCKSTYRLPCRELVNKSLEDVLWTDVRNDHVSLVATNRNDTSRNVYENSWIEFLRFSADRVPVSMVLLNRGAHYVPDDHIVRDVRVTLDWLRTFHSNVSIVWRNTPRGHVELERQSKVPLQTASNYTGLLPFHWEEFRRQNQLIRETLRNYYRGVLYLDVATMTELRPDSHMDGLHYCVPGPQSSWLKLLLNVVLLTKHRKP
jgi:hypothetical protein